MLGRVERMVILRYWMFIWCLKFIQSVIISRNIFHEISWNFIPKIQYFRQLRCNCICLGYWRSQRNCLWTSWSPTESYFHSISIIHKSINDSRRGWKFGTLGYGYKESWGNDILFSNQVYLLRIVSHFKFYVKLNFHIFIFHRLVTGQSLIIVNYAVDPFSGTFELCMIKNKLDYGSIIAGNLECHTHMKSI